MVGGTNLCFVVRSILKACNGAILTKTKTLSRFHPARLDLDHRLPRSHPTAQYVPAAGSGTYEEAPRQF
jgi:hypothetical protein